MANGSNLVRGVNELVSVLPAEFEPGDDHLAGRPLSSPQTGPSSESHQHSALFGRFFQSSPNFCLLLHVGAFLLLRSGAQQFFGFCHFLACCILCGKPQFMATCRFVPRV